MREARSVTVTAWINDLEDRPVDDMYDTFLDLLRTVEAAVESWHSRHEDVVDGVPVVKLR